MKAIVVLEYDVEPGRDLEDFKDEMFGNLGFLSEAGIRPGRLHLAKDLPALKVLSILEARKP